jgi:chemotaxis protein histidine kinase CheA
MIGKGVMIAVERICTEYNLKKEDVITFLEQPKGKAPAKPTCLIPFVKRVSGWCDGLRLNHGLYTQCTNKPMSTGSLCKVCEKQSVDGVAKHGLASERQAQGEMWRAPNNKAPYHFGKVFLAKEMKEEEVLGEIKRIYGLERSDLDEKLFENVKAHRGRPKKVSPIVEDSDEEVPVKKTRGRPRKSKKSVVGAVEAGDDLIDALVKQAEQAEAETTEAETTEESSTEDESSTESSGDEKTEEKTEEAGMELITEAPELTVKPKKAKRVKMTAEEKEAAKQAAKEAKQAAKEAAKAEKEAAKQAAKEAAKAEKEAAKQAAKEAKKAEKEAAKQAAKEAKEAEKKTKKAEKKEEPVVEVTEELSAEEGTEEVDVTQKMIDGREYLIDADNVVYDMTTQEPIGVYDEETEKINECEFEEEE